LISPKNFILILIATIAVSLVILLNPSSENESDFRHFTFDALYIEDKNSILITFSDTTGKSSFAILEILGMETTYHKEFEIVNSEFSKTIPIEKIPKYGWKTTPVTLEIMYGDTIVKMKTEIHEEDNPSPEIIFSSSSSN
tara:strand:- start:143 stop:562 length:420 start_codon:yes stop_codon:yes gene_type:complete